MLFSVDMRAHRVTDALNPMIRAVTMKEDEECMEDRSTERGESDQEFEDLVTLR